MEEKKLDNKNEKKGIYGIISLCLMIMRFISTGVVTLGIIINPRGLMSFIFALVSFILIIIPWLIISLVFSIIGIKKDKDVLSKIIMISDIVLIILEVIFIIIATVLVIFGMSQLNEGFNYTFNALKQIG